MRPPAHASFQHIQIISKKPEGVTKPEDDEPTFRQSSFIEDADSDVRMTAPACSYAMKSPESLANNTQGATFAAKARAAELQAARTRKELRSQHSSGVSLSTQVSTHETMTFKPKAKGGKVWKRLDLGDISTRSENSEGDSTPQRQDSSLSTHELPGFPSPDHLPATLATPKAVTVGKKSEAPSRGHEKKKQVRWGNVTMHLATAIKRAPSGGPEKKKQVSVLLLSSMPRFRQIPSFGIHEPRVWCCL